MDHLVARNVEWINTKILKIPKSQAFAYLYEFMEKTDKARQLYLRAKATLQDEIKKTPDDPRIHSSLGITLASLGESEAAIRESKQAIDILPVNKDAVYGTPFLHEQVLTYTILGKYDLALDKIEYLFLKIPSAFSPGWMTLDPRWDKLKKLPRYKQIMQKYMRTWQ